MQQQHNDSERNRSYKQINVNNDRKITAENSETVYLHKT